MGESDREAVVGGPGRNRLLEQRNGVSGPSRLLVELRRHQIVKIVVGIVLGEGPRPGDGLVHAVDLRFDPDQLGLQGRVSRLGGDRILQRGPRLGKMLHLA